MEKSSNRAWQSLTYLIFTLTKLLQPSSVRARPALCLKILSRRKHPAIPIHCQYRYLKSVGYTEWPTLFIYFNFELELFKQNPSGIIARNNLDFFSESAQGDQKSTKQGDSRSILPRIRLLIFWTPTASEKCSAPKKKEQLRVPRLGLPPHLPPHLLTCEHQRMPKISTSRSIFVYLPHSQGEFSHRPPFTATSVFIYPRETLSTYVSRWYDMHRWQEWSSRWICCLPFYLETFGHSWSWLCRWPCYCLSETAY